jgi:hypothetical protein
MNISELELCSYLGKEEIMIIDKYKKKRCDRGNCNKGGLNVLKSKREGGRKGVSQLRTNLICFLDKIRMSKRGVVEGTLSARVLSSRNLREGGREYRKGESKPRTNLICF